MNKNKGITKFFGKHTYNKLYTYDEFSELSENEIKNADVNLLSDQEKIYLEYSKINLQRTTRIHKTFKPNDNVVKLIMQFDKPQTWLMITEHWCGDSAQNLPYFVMYAKFNPLINIQIVLRDSNLEAIDDYFNSPTARSIPKIIGFDENGDELFIWGARPKIAQDLVMQLKAEGFSKEEFNEKLHLWYGRNRGKELEKEMISLFSTLLKKIV